MSKIRPKLVVGILIALFFGLSVFLRAYLPYDQIFRGDWIKLSSVDAYYHMTIVDNLVHNFPHPSSINPYFIYPNVQQVSLTFFQWLLAGVIWVIGLGAPTQHTVDVVGVYYPVVLAALTVIPVYFIGKELFNRWAGVIASALIAVLPGEFMGRSILGGTDQHVAETLFTTVTMMFLILAIKTASQRVLVFNHFKRRDWAVITRPVIYSLLGGVFLGIYLLTWTGALLFVFLIFVYFIIQFITDHLKRRPTDYLAVVNFIFFLVAIVVSLPPFGSLQFIALLVALVVPVILNLVSRAMVDRDMKPAYYPVSLAGFAIVVLLIFRAVNASLFGSMLQQFSIFSPTGPLLTTIEAKPIFFPQGAFTFTVVWGNFTTSFYLGLVSLCILIYLVIKQGNAEKSLLVVWSLVILAATLGQRRFAYYFAANVAILAGYLAVFIYFLAYLIVEYFRGGDTAHVWWQTLEYAGFKERVAKSNEIPRRWEYYELLGVPRSATDKQIKRAYLELSRKYRDEANRLDNADEEVRVIRKAYEVLSDHHKRRAYDLSHRAENRGSRKKARAGKGGFHITASLANVSFAALIIFLVVFLPLIEPTKATASHAPFAPTDAWCSSLTWMKENTPEPFANPDTYYERVKSPPLGGSYKYPESAYGVLAWWDYGYWITRIGRRLPNANPSQSSGPVIRAANFFLSQNESSAEERRKEFDSKYVIIDYPAATGKFYALVTWAGKAETEFFDYYLVPQENNQLVPAQLYYPTYYRSLSTRLYNFDGKAVTPQSSTVISYEEKADKKGQRYKVITDAKQFTTYEEAESYLQSQKSGSHRIVGTNPFISPIPLEALKNYKLLHSSEGSVSYPEVGTVPEVKIFEYIGDRAGAGL